MDIVDAAAATVTVRAVAGAVDVLVGPDTPDPDLAGHPSLTDILDGVAKGLSFVPTDDLVPLLRDVVEVTHRLEGLAVATAREAIERGIHQDSRGRVQPWLRDAVGLSGDDAFSIGTLVRAADSDPSARAIVADAITGTVHRSDAHRALRAVRTVRHTLPASHITPIAEAARLLARQQIRPKEWDAFTEQALAAFTAGPNGDDDCDHARRGMTPFSPLGNGLYRATITLDSESLTFVEAALNALSAPRPERDTALHAVDTAADERPEFARRATDPDTSLAANSCSHVDPDPYGVAMHGGDHRSPAQRRADALVLMARLAVDAQPTGPLGTATHATVILDHDTLIAAARDASSAGFRKAGDRRTEGSWTGSSGARSNGAASGGAAGSGPGDSRSEGSSSGSSDLGSAGAWGSAGATASGNPLSSTTEDAEAGRAAGAWADPRHGPPPSGIAYTGTRRPLTSGAARRLCCDAEVLPVVLDSESRPTDVGYTKRLATAAQRAAIAIRDGGCTYPGCDAPMAWCIVHHIIHWADGGPTDLSNLAALCPRHHRVVHRRGFTADIAPTATGRRIIWRNPYDWRHAA